MRIATRGSALALWQAEHVAALLTRAGVAEVEIVEVQTTGDRDTTSPLHSIGGKGVFCKEIQRAVLDGRADVAVHSAKDLPAITPAGLTLAAIPSRGDARDALVGASLFGLPDGASVATGSVRRRAQLRRLRPDLTFHELRGNIQTRLAKAEGFDAIVMASVAIERLALDIDMTVDVLPPETLVPQVGQGALAIECRHDDAHALDALRHLDDPTDGRLVRAERAFLRELGGDCSLPAAAHATGARTGTITMTGFLAAPDHRHSHQLRLTGDDGEQLGREVARTLRTALHDR